MAVSPGRRILAAESNLRGGEIFAAKCVACHGPNGEGTADDGPRLEGDYSVAQLSETIGETMPEDDPGSLSADEVQAVATYVHARFYSPIAQARNRPARIELARLTVDQYRQAVTDVITPSGRPPKSVDGEGLRGEYYNGRRPGNNRERVAVRVDPQVDFDFGDGAPLADISEPRTFSIRWSGSLLALETGEYEFIIHTEHAARLWINNMKVPLIDAWVKSGDQTEYRASQFLVGGRAYALRLIFSKAKQGVDDSDKQKEKPPSAPASIALVWQRPGGAPQPIPARNLSPHTVPEAFICTVPFPPDDRSYGWVRGTTISAAWDEATTTAAIEAAEYAAARVDRLAQTREDAADRTAKLRDFCRAFAERAFRQPLNGELEEQYVDRQFAKASDADAAVWRVVLLVLKSPRFLFREVGGGPSPFCTAARLAFGMWDSIPDGKLLNAAKANKLVTADQVRRQAERMLADPRAKTKLRGFLLSWLHLDSGADLTKDRDTFPDFDELTIADLRTSLELFLDDVMWSDAADYRRLFLSDEVYLNERLAKFYGVAGDFNDGFVKVRLDDGRRAGVLTHPYMMARFAHVRESSPIHRGVFLARGILGQSLPPPPEAFIPFPPDSHPDLTTRERIALQTKAATCMSCHSIINPLGFTLERFDAVGRYRETDRGKPVDDASAYHTPRGATVNLRGARDLAEFLAGSDQSHSAFVEQLFHHLVQQPVQAYGSTMLEDLRQTFAAHDFNIRKLMVEIMVATALVDRKLVHR